MEDKKYLEETKQLENAMYDLSNDLDSLQEIEDNVEADTKELFDVHDNLVETRKFYIRFNKQVIELEYGDYIVAMKHIKYAQKALKKAYKQIRSKTKELNKKNDKLHKKYHKLTGCSFLNC